MLALILCLLVVSPASSAAAPLASSAQAAPPMKAGECKKCHGAGRLPCPEHPKNECEFEDKVLFCSIVADCPVCGGAGFVWCETCKKEEAKQALDARRATIQARRPILKPIDDRMGRPLRKVETAHMVMMWDIDKFKIEKRWVDAHEALHVYAERMEKLYADYCARLSVEDKAFEKKCWIFVWWRDEDHRDGAVKFCEQSAPGGVKLMGPEARYSVCGNKQHFITDEQLYRNIVHCVTHLLLAHMKPQQWIGNIKGGWADEGLAHWFEDRYWGVCDVYCYQEQNSNIDFKAGKFRLAVRRMVTEGTSPPIAEVFQQNIDTLTLPMNAACFSYVDFLMYRDGPKFKELITKLKTKVPSRDALQQVYGMSPMDLEAQWKAWVLATYPTR